MAVSDDEFTPLLEKFVKMGFVGIMMLFFSIFLIAKISQENVKIMA